MSNYEGQKEIMQDGDIHKDSDEELIFNPYNSIM